MWCSPDEGSRINSFALVSYIPDPLGEFLDRLRRDLVLGCAARSHVTILPPRVLTVPDSQAGDLLRQDLQEFAPFRLELGDVEVFEKTSVVFLGIKNGQRELEAMHQALNHDGLWFDEPYQYHPHITLAQGFDAQLLPELHEIAKQRWSEFHGEKAYIVDVLTFVQNTAENRWLDLEGFPLRERVGSVRK